MNDLQDHLDEYAGEVKWLIEHVGGIVDRYESSGVEAAKAEMVVDHWEAVKFHSAIETNYIPLYASIWQGLFGVKTAVEGEQPVETVRAELAKLEQVLWQSLGAVKLAAQYQEQGLLQEVQTREAVTPTATLVEIKQKLDRVLAKYAEQLSDEAIKIVQETYLTRFEGVEGVLIEQDAELVEDLEIDFNVRLPKAIEDGASVDEVRGVILTMQGKLDQARSLLKEQEKSRAKVF
ncbi:MAG: hypothetical protein JJ957_12215 [Pseudomonadales bacterium]|nr:hypothetical protein [Pseudomonadales bacterium]MBO6823085.1 hypothetical protein [Pseudomonadales bacterium]